MNSTIKTLLTHRSIRKFTPQKIDDEIIRQLADVARFASSSNHLQCVSIVRVTDAEIRRQLKACASNQEYVQAAAEFWVFCIDFNKHRRISPQAQTDYTEVLLIGSVDAGIMAQNVLAAAESLGLGGVYIGALRNEIETVGELLELPEHCVPLFGLCLGYPDQDPPQKPRLSRELMFFENHYKALEQDKLAEYNAQVAEYYQQRSRTDTDWARNVAKTLGKPVRPHMLAYLQKQGFAKK